MASHDDTLGVMVRGRGELEAVSQGTQRPPKRLLQGNVAGHVSEPALLDEVVVTLQQLHRREGIETTLAVGELILTRFFGSDAALWRQRNRNKNNSIRRLASRPDCPMKRSKLNDAVAIYVVACDHPRVRTFGHILPGHIRVVFALPSADQLDFLEQAEVERWSVRRLKEEVTQHRRAQGERRGRPTISPDDKFAAQLSRHLAALTGAVNAALEEPLHHGLRKALREASDELRRLDARVQEALEERTSAVQALRPSKPQSAQEKIEATG